MTERSFADRTEKRRRNVITAAITIKKFQEILFNLKAVQTVTYGIPRR